MCTHIKIFRYLVTGCHKKLSSLYRWYQKLTVGPTFVRTEILLSRAVLENVLGAFYRGWYVVVHPCSNFSIRRQMAPVQSIKFQTANFPIFCPRIIVIFCITCIARKVFSLVIIGNGKQVLPVLHWLEVVIAFVSSLIMLCLFNMFIDYQITTISSGFHNIFDSWSGSTSDLSSLAEWFLRPLRRMSS